jgi:hypothetical protein
VTLGGLVWLVGVLILELTYDPSQDDLPISFSILALVAGLAVGWGCWTAASSLETRLGRIGLRSVGGCSLALGVGVGLDLIPDMFLAFLLAYTVGLFLLPLAFLVLASGSPDRPFTRGGRSGFRTRFLQPQSSRMGSTR